MMHMAPPLVGRSGGGRLGRHDGGRRLSRPRRVESATVVRVKSAGHHRLVTGSDVLASHVGAYSEQGDDGLTQTAFPPCKQGRVGVTRGGSPHGEPHPFGDASRHVEACQTEVVRKLTEPPGSLHPFPTRRI